MSEPHQKGVIPGRIDHHEVMGALNRADGGGEVGDLDRLVSFHRAGLSALDTIMRRQLELYARALSPGAAVLDVMGESFLSAVEIDSGDALARLKQRHRDVQRLRWIFPNHPSRLRVRPRAQAEKLFGSAGPT